jgi:pimeloyl-ACP methyl ester carboxylesterase
VVIDAGLANGAASWDSLLARLAERTRSCAYSRAGYPPSEPGPLPRHSARVAEELHALLAAAEIEGPYVLVGHSIGGLNAQVFAASYPEDVAGLVLLDPPPLAWITGEGYPALRDMADGMTNQWQEESERLLAEPDPEARTQGEFLRTVASEHRQMFEASAEAAARIESFGRIPLLAIASGQAAPQFGAVAEEYQRFWADQSLQLSQKSEQGEFVLIEESSHNLHVDAPDRVVDGIFAVLLLARQGT